MQIAETDIYSIWYKFWQDQVRKAWGVKWSEKVFMGREGK